MQRKYAKLDVVPGGDPQRFHISKHDEKSRHLLFSLFASEGALELPNGTTASLEGRKPNGTELKISGSLSGIGVTIDLPASAADTAGEIPCNVVLTANGKRLYTEVFLLVVDPDTEEGERVYA